MESAKKLDPIITELILRGRKLNISLIFIPQYYFNVHKTIGLNATTHYLIVKIPNKRELWQRTWNHSSDIDFKDFNFPSDNQDLGKSYNMTVSEKLRTINNKIMQNKAQYDLDR